jgi:hypothetical protein
MASEADHTGRAAGDMSMSLGAALLGSLVLGALFGVETQSDLLLLLGVSSGSRRRPSGGACRDPDRTDRLEPPQIAPTLPVTGNTIPVM